MRYTDYTKAIKELSNLVDAASLSSDAEDLITVLIKNEDIVMALAEDV